MDFDSAPKMVQDTILDTIKREKGVSNDPDDSGGLTKDGITAATAKKYGYNDVLSMTDIEIKDLYLNEYYLSPHIDLVQAVSDKIAGEIFDTGVNCGYKLPIKWLQNNLNLLNNRGKYFNDITVDGVLGDETIDALKALIGIRGFDNVEKTLYNALNSLQAAHYYNLALKRDKDEKFYWGWLTKRCDYIV